MIINRLLLRNFGLFAGDHAFDLRPQGGQANSRPIVLFGGKNGAGKTTILEALRLCLYGQQALGLRTTAADYQAHLDKRLHRSRFLAAHDACITLEFEHVHQGEPGLFRVERSWGRTDKGISEQIALRRNGEVQFGLGPDYWPVLLKELIPIGLADLFLFDGEQIQRLADDEYGGPGLSNALKELLGLNLIEQLEADLRVYLQRLGAAGSGLDAAERLEQFRKEKQRWEDELTGRQQDSAGVGVRLERLRNKVAEKERDIASKGGVFAERRSAAEREKQELEVQVRHAEQRVIEACAGLLPFALAPTLLQSLIMQIDHEEQQEYAHATALVLREQAALLALHMTESQFWEPMDQSLTLETRARLAVKVQQALLAQAPRPEAGVETPLVHGLSSQDRQRIRTWFDQCLGSVRPQVTADLAILLESRVALERIEVTLHAVPPNEYLAPLLQELSDLHQEANRYEVQQAALEEKVHHASVQLEAAVRQMQRLDMRLKQEALKEQRGDRAARTLDMLPQFRTAQLRRKIGDLEAAFTEYFNRLARKSEFVSHVIINEHDFTMTLVSNDGRYIPKTQLSSGEKQIYAIALLWALRAVAGRPLPVVIDTPLGRLDSSHRQHLVNQYFPNASHQVIVLSTDTEIDAGFFAELEPYVSHAYHLIYDDASGTTHAEEGYFWQSAVSSQEVMHALQ